MSLFNKQVFAETTFSRATVRLKVMEYFEEHDFITTRLLQSTVDLKNFLELPNYSSAQQCVINDAFGNIKKGKPVNLIDGTELSLTKGDALLFKTVNDLFYFTVSNPVNSLAGLIAQLQPRLKKVLPILEDRIWLLSEVIHHASENGMVTLVPPVMKHDDDDWDDDKEANPVRAAGWKVYSRFKMPERLKNVIAATMYLPPMLVPPREVTNNSDTPYITDDSVSLISGNPLKFHNEDIGLDVVRTQNSVPLCLDRMFIDNVADSIPASLLEVKDNWRLEEKRLKCLKSHVKLLEVSTKVHAHLVRNGNRFYIPWKRDNRARLYAMAHHVNPQGNSHQKCAVDFDLGMYGVKVVVDNIPAPKHIAKSSTFVLREHIIHLPSTATGFQTFSDYEYHLIEGANHLIGDKHTFETRIATMRHLIASGNLVVALDYIDDDDKKHPIQCDEPIHYIKWLLVHERIQAGVPVSNPAHMDATASGSQIQACNFGCVVSARFTNLIDPTVRRDSYQDVGDKMCDLTHRPRETDIRNIVKKPFVARNFGSETSHIKPWYGDVPMQDAFVEAMRMLLPAGELNRNTLKWCWNSEALAHTYTLPDGSVAHIKVIAKSNAPVVTDRFGIINYEFWENKAVARGRGKGTKSIIVNPTHSMDGYFVSEMVRRCNYNVLDVTIARDTIRDYLIADGVNLADVADITSPVMFGTNYLTMIRNDTDVAAFIEYFGAPALVQGLVRLEYMLTYEPFPVLTIHDSFGARYCNLNTVRWWYKEFLAELADSNWLSDTIFTLTGERQNIKQDEIGHLIRATANYALS